jgi:hypothetical protein
MTGTIPPAIGQLRHLVKLDLRNNIFNGTIPTEIGQMTALVTIDLRE